MKGQNHKLKEMDINEASKIVQKLQKEGGEDWFDHWNLMNNDLQFIKSSLDVVVHYCMEKDDSPLIIVLDDLMSRVDKVQSQLDKVIHELGDKHRLGPHLPKAPDRILVLPKVTLEKYRLV
jgi:hypothetical protein